MVGLISCTGYGKIPPMNTYRDTRGGTTTPLTFTETIIAGIAPSGGLYVPEEVPHVPLEWFEEFAKLPYAERAACVYQLFGTDVPDRDIAVLMERAYAGFAHEDVAPLVRIPGADGLHVLELFHGPTSAFKDMALQCLPQFLSYALEKHGGDLLILVATSGDTGTAALDGFSDREHVQIAVLYPEGGVSDIQYRQMATQTGENVQVYAARGNFDDCQTTVKRIFADGTFATQLADETGLTLSSANSINWGRLMPQIVYYLSAYADLAEAGDILPGEPIDVCVPTGNFGNILAAYYAREMGCPIERLFCASNDNDILTDFINTGVYDIRERTLLKTPSPSMDILISSNLERLLYELTDRDADRISTWMTELSENGVFRVDRETFSRVRALFSADRVDSAASLRTIGRIQEQYGYLLDPHTAVAFEVAERLRGENPVVIASTAHWAKFGADVYRGLTGVGPEDALPDEVAELNGVELARRIVEMTGAAGIPERIEALEHAEVRFTDVVDAKPSEVEQVLLAHLTDRSDHADIM